MADACSTSADMSMGGTCEGGGGGRALRAGVCAIIRLVVFCGITHGLQRGDYTASGCVMVCCVYASTTDALAWLGTARLLRAR